MLQENALASLKTLLPKGQVFTDRASLIAYEADGGIDKGLPEGVVLPRNAEEVARIACWASEHRVALVARGAGTGLSGGAVADRGGVIVDFAHMNHLLDLDEHGRSAVAEPALINLRLDEHAKTKELYFPPDPSSQRASTIGGNVAENSGGPHCFKYGVTTNYITGLDVVLSNGERIRVGGRALDYPEYDLCGLITGSEGMLALITAIDLRLLRNPPGVKTMLAIFDTPEEASQAVSAIIASGLVPATMEMMDQKITRMIEPFAHAGLPLDAGAILIIEVDGYPESLDAQIEEIARILHQQGVREMQFAHSEEERAKIWLARKSVAGAITRLAPSYYTVDITVPRSRLSEMLVEVDTICERHGLRTGRLMHAGDGNLHPMLLIPEPGDSELMHHIHSAGWEIVKCCVEMGGSLTGEHGVGIEKREYMPLMHKPHELMAMWDVKQAFDPYNILNPGKVFPTPKDDDSGPFAGYSLDYQQAEANFPDSLPQARETFTPTTAEEAAQGLRALAKSGRHVQIGGACLKAGQDNTVRLSTEALRGIKVYAPDDLYITVGAGTTLAEIQAFLTEKGKQLPLVSPWPDATIGGLVAANINSPQRMLYGSIRDLVLYMTVVLPDGRIIRTGRPIVKNVAGYDMTKIFIGSHGTLGLITDVTLKFTVLPRSKHTLLVPVDDLRHGLIWGRQLLPLVLTASSLILYKGHIGDVMDRDVADVSEHPYHLIYTAEGLPANVQTECEQVRQTLQAMGGPEPLEIEGISGTDVWVEQLRRGISGQISEGHPYLQIRVGVPVKDLPTYVQDQAELLNNGTFIADISNGFVYASKGFETVEEASTWLAALRQPALALEGYAIVIDQADELQGQLDCSGYRPQGLSVMQALKARWDGQGMLVNADGCIPV